jgi:hypothetical protein
LKKQFIWKTSIVLMNIAIMAILLFFQNERYTQILNYKSVNVEFNEIEKTVKMMEEYGDSINWIVGVSIILLLINFFLFKKWCKSKKWVIEGILIFIFTITLGITYNYQKVTDYKIGMKTTANN